MTRTNPAKWSFDPPAPPNWEAEKPRYRLTVALKPPAFDRQRLEAPWKDHVDPDVNLNDPARIETWQYAGRFFAKGETITSTEWPHSSMQPLNYSARKVTEFFSLAQKSRLAISPWHADRVRLEDGMAFSNVEFDARTARPVAGHAHGAQHGVS